MPYKDVEKRREYARTWSKTNTTDIRRRRIKLKMKYGLSLEDYDTMMVKQEGRCAICKKIPNSYLCVDHDHKTKTIRGLLCHSCNVAIGLLNEDINSLMRAIAYLDPLVV